MTTKIQKWGNSLAVRLPKDLVRKLRLAAGSQVAVQEERSRITITRIPPAEKHLRKDAWRTFIIPTGRRKKENVSAVVDKIAYGVHR